MHDGKYVFGKDLTYRIEVNGREVNLFFGPEGQKFDKSFWSSKGDGLVAMLNRIGVKMQDVRHSDEAGFNIFTVPGEESMDRIMCDHIFPFLKANGKLSMGEEMTLKYGMGINKMAVSAA